MWVADDMLILRTGLPGASKTLNTLKEICEAHHTHATARPIHYNNIRLLMLDMAVCSSFAGWFYGVFFPNLDADDSGRYRKVLLRIHSDDEVASSTHFPHLEQLYDAWLTKGGDVDLWLTYVRKCYNPAALKSLNDYLSLADSPALNELRQFNLDWRNFTNPTAWYELPRNSIIVIDECQQWFPPRGSSARAPKHCSEFETHRHKGFDIHLITQDAMLLDSHVRRLTNRHINFHNPFASKVVNRYEADKVFNPSDYHDRKNAISSVIKRDSNFYGVYWSADVHTHKARIPKKVFLIIPAILTPIVAIWLLMNVILGGDDDSDAVASSAVVASGGSAPPAASSPPVRQQITTKPSLAFSDGDHPLAAICKEFHLTSIQFNSSSQPDFLFQCEIPVESDSNDEYSNVRYEVFHSSYLSRLGYAFDFQAGLASLTYNQVMYLFPHF